MWFEVAAGSLLWVTAAIVMSLWTLWFGVVLMRTPAAAPEGTARAYSTAAPAPGM
jgi:hypothetical protein